MAERTVITELVQVGVESSYGTGVPATRKLAAISIDVSPEAGVTLIEPMGYKAPTGSVLTQEWATGDIGGTPVYNELVIALTSLLKTVTATTTTGVSTWVWDWSPTTVETVTSYTIEQGDAATRAHKVTGGLFNSLSLGFTRTGEPTLGGSILAQAFADGITPTTALTALTPIPISPNHIDVYADATWAGKGTTKLLRVMEASFNVTDMWGPLWVLNTANASFVEKIQQKPTIEMQLTVEADSAGMAFLANNLRLNTGMALELKATGPTISGGTPTTAHSLKIDMWGVLSGPPAFGDTDGVRTAQWTWRAAPDATSGKILIVTLINGVATNP